MTPLWWYGMPLRLSALQGILKAVAPPAVCSASQGLGLRAPCTRRRRCQATSSGEPTFH